MSADAKGNHQKPEGKSTSASPIPSNVYKWLVSCSQKAEKAVKPTKAKKGSNGPKRPLSAYMFFSQDWRERIKTENPDAGFGMRASFTGDPL